MQALSYSNFQLTLLKEVDRLVSSDSMMTFYFNIITVATFLATASVSTLAITTDRHIELTATTIAGNTFLFVSVVAGMGSAVHILLTLVSGYLRVMIWVNGCH